MAADSAKKPEGGTAGNSAGVDALAGARAARSKRKQVQLNPRQLFVRQTARNAIKGAKLIIERIERGDDVSADAIEACTLLAGKTAVLLIGD